MLLMVGGVLAVLPPPVALPTLSLIVFTSVPLIAPLGAAAAEPISQRKLAPVTVWPLWALQMLTSAPLTAPLPFTSPRSVRKFTVAEARVSLPALVTLETVRATFWISPTPAKATVISLLLKPWTVATPTLELALPLVMGWSKLR